MSVLVLGATSAVGVHVVTALVVRQVATRVLVQDPFRARALIPAVVDIRAGIPAVADDLLTAAEGVDSLFLHTPHDHRMAEQQLRIIHILRRTGIRIVKLSGTSAGTTRNGPHRQHWEVEKALVASGGPHVALRPSPLMQEQIDQVMMPAVRFNGLIPNAIGSSGTSFVNARDVGECAAEVLSDGRWSGRTLVLTGPRAVTVQEIAHMIGDRIGQRITQKGITPAEGRRRMEAQGMEPWGAENFEEMCWLLRQGRSESVSDDVQRILRRPPTTVEDYIHAHPELAVRPHSVHVAH